MDQGNVRNVDGVSYNNLPNWFEISARSFFERFVPNYPFRALQIGVWTGDATQWLLENSLAFEIHDVDSWSPQNPKLSYSASELDIDAARKSLEGAEIFYDLRFKANPYVVKHKLFSDLFFSRNTQVFDFVYIDGDHSSIQTAIDGLNAFQCLAKGGIMAFDDYLWDLEIDEYLRPKNGIDGFLKIAGTRVKVLEIGEQVRVQKI
jgi:hypothetical protein